MNKIKLILTLLAMPAFFAVSAQACGGDKGESKDKEAIVSTQGCGGGSCDKGDKDKKEAVVIGQGSCGGCKKDKGEDKEA